MIQFMPANHSIKNVLSPNSCQGFGSLMYCEWLNFHWLPIFPVLTCTKKAICCMNYEEKYNGHEFWTPWMCHFSSIHKKNFVPTKIKPSTVFSFMSTDLSTRCQCRRLFVLRRHAQMYGNSGRTGKIWRLHQEYGRQGVIHLVIILKTFK